MNILVIGGGGREHAVIWKLKQSANCGKVYCIPGNAGISELAECHPEIGACDLDKILDFVRGHADIGLTVVAPDDPLALGLVNLLEENGFRAFGPRKEAAIIEASKAYSKELMKKYGIPTAGYESFTDYAAAKAYVETASLPVVLKADGLALGKGVLICETREAALEGLSDIMEKKVFGRSGDCVVVEEFMTGQEVSVLAFCDGEHIVPMVSCQDHKRAFTGDKGLNTGGMGTFSPSRHYTPEIAAWCMEHIYLPTVEALKRENRTFKGIVFFGLMLTKDGPKVLEYNARFGDPETQSVLPRLKGDLLEIFEACIDGTLDRVKIEWEDNCTLCVVAASGGYPQSYQKGLPIEIGALEEGITVFHAGTKFDDAGRLVTNGGRVLGVCAGGGTIEEAREKVYRNIDNIRFQGMFYRTDIGIKK